MHQFRHKQSIAKLIKYRLAGIDIAITEINIGVVKIYNCVCVCAWLLANVIHGNYRLNGEIMMTLKNERDSKFSLDWISIIIIIIMTTLPVVLNRYMVACTVYTRSFNTALLINHTDHSTIFIQLNTFAIYILYYTIHMHMATCSRHPSLPLILLFIMNWSVDDEMVS